CHRDAGEQTAGADVECHRAYSSSFVGTGRGSGRMRRRTNAAATRAAEAAAMPIISGVPASDPIASVCTQTRAQTGYARTWARFHSPGACWRIAEVTTMTSRRSNAIVPTATHKGSHGEAPGTIAAMA